MTVKLNIGAGTMRMEGWTSLGLDDAHDIRGDIRTIPLENDSVDEAMAIHVLEHLYLWDVPAALTEWLRVLKPGATLAIEMPDLIKCCRNVVDGAEPRRGLWGIYGDDSYGDVLMLHKHGQTPESLKKLLREAGFIKAKEKSPLFHGRRLYRDMRVEARKPLSE